MKLLHNNVPVGRYFADILLPGNGFIRVVVKTDTTTPAHKNVYEAFESKHPRELKRIIQLVYGFNKNQTSHIQYALRHLNPKRATTKWIIRD